MGRRKGPALTREDVVSAALRCVQADGPDALGVSAVARELGIKPPSVYNHVGKGDALAWAVVVEGNRRLLALLATAVDGQADPREQLRILAGTTRRWALDNAGLYGLMARVPPKNDDPEFRPLLDRMLHLFGEPLGQLGVAPADRVHAIRSLRAAMHGFVLLESSGQFQLSDRPDASYRWLVESVLRGLGPAADKGA